MLRLPRRFRAGGGDKSPLSIAGDSRGVLCLHGITGTPFEIRPLAEALGRRGCTRAGADAGGTRRNAGRAGGQRLARLAALRRRRRWTSLQARVGGGPVAICGFSMGGLLALRLARLFPERVAALVVMSTPLRLRRFQVAGIRALTRLPIDFRAHPTVCVPKLDGSDISDPDLRYENPGLRAFPIAALEALLDLMDTVRADLPAIRTPTLVVHGRQDHTVPMEDSLELTGCLGSERHRTAVARQVVPHRHPRRRTRHRHRRRDALPRRARGLAGGPGRLTAAMRQSVLFSPAPCKT